MKYRITCIGNQWRGSNDGALFRAFARGGHLIDIIDDRGYIPADVFSTTAKALRKICTSFFRADYNKSAIERIRAFQPELVCVFKGAALNASTLKEIKALKIPLICVYPDVSFFDHGPRIPACIPYYDYIFTTKSFGINDLLQYFNYTNASLLYHGADPDIHRVLDTDSIRSSGTECDASFIGTYSPKKDRILRNLDIALPDLNLKIWGGHWDLAKNWPSQGVLQGQRIIGDRYALAIQTSKINLGILSEAGTRSQSGDLITSRTFHIPGAGGFLLHERTPEFSTIFQEGVEAEGFEGEAELADKIKYYLAHEDERKKIAKAGHELIMRHHTSDHRANEILQKLNELGMLSRN